MVQISDAEQRHPLTGGMSTKLVPLEPYSLVIHKQRATSDAREMLFRQQACSGDSLLEFGH